MNSHADIQRRLPAYCERDLEPAERQLVDNHLTACPSCRAELADLQTALRLIRSTPEVDPPPWMTAHIMARIREQQAGKRSWLQRLFFPLHIKLPIEAVALLVVCVGGFYLSRSVETEMSRGKQQQLQEIPAPQVPTPTQPATQAPARAGKQVQPAAPAAPARQPTPRREEFPVEAPAQLPSTAPYAPPPAAYKEPYGGKAESLKVAPRAESSNRAREAAPELNRKGRSLERMNDMAAPAASSRAADAPAAPALPQGMLRLDMADPSTAPALIRETLLRCGGSITEEPDPSRHRITVRIPAARLGELLQRLEGLGRITERPAAPPAGTQLLELTIQW